MNTRCVQVNQQYKSTERDTAGTVTQSRSLNAVRCVRLRPVATIPHAGHVIVTCHTLQTHTVRCSTWSAPFYASKTFDSPCTRTPSQPCFHLACCVPHPQLHSAESSEQNRSLQTKAKAQPKPHTFSYNTHSVSGVNAIPHNSLFPPQETTTAPQNHTCRVSIVSPN